MKYKLEKPSAFYEASLASYISECKALDRVVVPAEIDHGLDNFLDFVKLQDDYSNSVNLPKGWVAASLFFLVDEHEEIVAVSHLRHELTEALLKKGGHIGYSVRPSLRGKGICTLVFKETLAIARQMGIKNILMTCDESNIRSIKVIENNGGILENQLLVGDSGVKTNRYWIDL